MKLLFFGNCQAEALASLTSLNNPGIEVEYTGSSDRVRRYDPARTAKLFDWCDRLIAQPIHNMDNPDNHVSMTARFGAKLVFIPYVYLDGIYSICRLPPGRNGTPGFVGDAPVRAELERHGLDTTLRRFRNGRLGFNHARRFERTLATLEEREAVAHVRVGDWIRDTYRRWPPMLTHNHPHPEMLNHIGETLAALLGVEFRRVTPEAPENWGMITLPDYGRVLSPQGVADLGLDYPPEPDWEETGTAFIREIAGVQPPPGEIVPSFRALPLGSTAPMPPQGFGTKVKSRWADQRTPRRT